MSDTTQASADAVRVRAQVASDWAQAAAGWDAWETHLTSFLAPVTERMLVDARPLPGERVLDIGCGTGDPAIALARAVEPGEVVAIDISPEMLAIARQRAAAVDATRVTWLCASGDTLPFAPASFDLVTARFSIIFFPDVQAGLRRLHDVLRPGGRITVSAWADPDSNPAFGIPLRALRAVSAGPGPDPDMPGPLRFSRPGEMAAAVAGAGFSQVRVTDVRTYQYGRTLAVYWEMLQQVSTQFRKQFAVLTPAQREEVRADFERMMQPFVAESGAVRVPGCARVATALRT
jgi:ubiquinone/menaquinone biosynthesis C-methylase UbiE